jgi:hypothetical protein
MMTGSCSPVGQKDGGSRYFSAQSKPSSHHWGIKAKWGEKVTLQSRVVRNKFCCGLGVRAVRAGSIGRDRQRVGESAEPPPDEAGGLGPRPLHEEISALWFQADRPDPQAMAPICGYAKP